MGGAQGALKLLKRLPSNWTSLEFDATPVDRFLSELDFFLHFPHEDYIEEFGRNVMEAMAQGVPAILPPAFAETFGDAGDLLRARGGRRDRPTRLGRSGRLPRPGGEGLRVRPPDLRARGGRGAAGRTGADPERGRRRRRAGAIGERCPIRSARSAARHASRTTGGLRGRGAAPASPTSGPGSSSCSSIATSSSAPDSGSCISRRRSALAGISPDSSATATRRRTSRPSATPTRSGARSAPSTSAASSEGLPAERYDLVLHNHVLEHLPCNVTLALQRAASRGKAGRRAPVLDPDLGRLFGRGSRPDADRGRPGRPLRPGRPHAPLRPRRLRAHRRRGVRTDRRLQPDRLLSPRTTLRRANVRKNQWVCSGSTVFYVPKNT